MQGQHGHYPEDEDPFGYGGGMDDLDVPDQSGPHTVPPRAGQTLGESVPAPAAPSAPGSASGIRPGTGDRPWYDSDDEDPFGFGGGMDDLDRAPSPTPPHRGSGADRATQLPSATRGVAEAPSGPAPAASSAPHRPPREASRTDNTPREAFPVARPRDVAGDDGQVTSVGHDPSLPAAGATDGPCLSPLDLAPPAEGGGLYVPPAEGGARSGPAPAASSAPSHPTTEAGPAPASQSSAASSGRPRPKVETGADGSATCRADRRTALAAHFARRPAAALARREAGLQRSMLDLQRQCADLSRTMADVHARQGPLVQRLHAAQAALTTLSSSPASAGSAAVQALQNTLSQALRAHRSMQPSP